jgi:atypical dual specificity phosphatase
MSCTSSRRQWPPSNKPPLDIPSIISPSYPSPPQTYSYQRPSNGANEIIPRLYISDLSFAENAACLSTYGITHIVSAISSSVLIPPESVLHPQPRHLQVRVEDFPFAELAAHLPITTAWIREALRNPDARVLVHCAEGISRSVSVVAAFLIAQYGWSPAQAVQYIKSKRRAADPNFGFVQQLGEYARSLKRTEAPSS